MRENASSVFIKIILGIIVIVFVFLGVGSYNSQKFNRIALVNDDAIGVEEYQQVYQNMVERLRQQFGNNLSEDMLQYLQVKQQALDSLIHKYLMLQECEQLNLRVTDTEVAEWIRSIPAFQTSEGRFDGQRYTMLLQHNRLTPQAFEAMQRETLLIEKLENMILGSIKVSEVEAEDYFFWKNTRIDLNFIRFSPDSYQKTTVSDAEIHKFFEEHGDQYKTNPMIQVRYLKFSPEDYTAQVQLDASEQEAELSMRENRIREKSRDLAYDAAEAVFEVADEGGDLESLAHARDIEFLDTGFFDHKGPEELGVHRAAFANVAFGLSDHEISGITELGESYYIIQQVGRQAPHLPELEDVQTRVKDDLLAQKQDKAAFKDAEIFLEELKNSQSISKTADKLNKTVQTTGFFKRTEAIPHIGFEQKMIETAFLLSAENPWSPEVLKGRQDYFVFALKARELPDTADLKPQKEKILEDLLAHKQRQVMTDWLGELKRNSDIQIEERFKNQL
jgi:peptidyl-prolyl cis-trans isomerase D